MKSPPPQGEIAVFLDLPVEIWAVLVVYSVGILLLGWWSKRGIKDQEGYLLGNRQFGVWWMIMHAFGAGGLFIVKPSRQSWVGFLVILGA
jgi:hypothetical protein